MVRGPRLAVELPTETARLLGVTAREISMPRTAVLTAARLADGWARLRRQPSLLSRANMLERIQPYWVCASTKTQHTFAYAPATSLVQGLAETLRWYQAARWL